MSLVTCCGGCELKDGARNAAIISMLYDLAASAVLLLILILWIPELPWRDPPEHNLLYYRIMLIITISVRVIHLIPSFLLLYSTWEEIQRGVSSWLFMSFIDILLHGAWIPVPFIMQWPLDKTVIHVSLLLVGILIIIYFLFVVSSYLTYLKDRDHDVRSRRRLKEYYS